MTIRGQLYIKVIVYGANAEVDIVVQEEIGQIVSGMDHIRHLMMH